ncbi:UNVERIFIED_CONTAM: hypothetical protein FKN15_025024 [Acipenser sinensis]
MTSSKTSPQTLQDSSRSLCCHVRTSAMAIGLVHMMFSFTLLMDTIVKVSYGKDSCGFPHPPFLSFKERVLDTTTNFLLIFGMFVTGLSLLYGVLKVRASLSEDSDDFRVLYGLQCCTNAAFSQFPLLCFLLLHNPDQGDNMTPAESTEKCKVQEGFYYL